MTGTETIISAALAVVMLYSAMAAAVGLRVMRDLLVEGWEGWGGSGCGDGGTGC